MLTVHGGPHGEPPNIAGGIDCAGLLERFGGDPQIMALVIEEFLVQSPTQLSDVRDSVTARDAMALARSAHKLKGAVAIFGGGPVVEATLQLERAGAAGDLTEADAALLDLQVQFGRLHDALRRLAA